MSPRLQETAAPFAGHIPNLDGLRALAIALVLLHHAPAMPAGLAAVVQENGRHGVSLFFVISGYLIATLLLREQKRDGSVDLGAFYRRRMARLMPLYYAVLLFHVLLVVGLGQFSPSNRALFLEKLPSFALYYSNLVPHPTEGPFFFAWSLAAEEQFYLLAGLGFRWLGRRSIALVAVLLFAAKVALFASLPAAAAGGALGRAALSYQEPLSLGVLLGLCAATAQGARACRQLGRAPMLCALLVAVGALLVLAPLGPRSGARCELLYVLLTLLVAGSAFRAPLPLLGGPQLSLVGKASYGIYLLHMLAIDTLKRLLPQQPVAVLLLALALVIPLAILVHLRFELPLIRWRARAERARRDARTHVHPSPTSEPPLSAEVKA